MCSTTPDIGGVTGYLDMQDIELPSAFADQTLTSIELVDNGAPGLQRAILDGATVESVPEPSSIVLLAFSIAWIVAFGVRERGLYRHSAKT